MFDLKTIVARSQIGDAEAYGHLVEQFQDMAVGYGYAILRDMHLAQDAAQEAFLEAFRNLSRLHAPEAFPGLLRKIVFKHCDRLTRRDRRFQIVSIEAALDKIDPAPTPEISLEEQEMRQVVYQAIEALSEQERTVVSMFYISDYSQKEIAVFLDVPVTTVKNRLRSARKRLKERLWTMVEDNLHDVRPSKDDQFVNKILKLMAPTPSEHGEEIYRIFDLIGRQDMANQARKGRIVDSHYDWKTSRIGLLDNLVVTHFGVYDLTLRFGTAHIRAAGVNMETMHPDVDDPALMDQTIEDALVAMKTRGYDLSVIRNASLERYRPFGYVYAMPDCVTYFISTEDLPSDSPDAKLQEISKNDIHSHPSIAEIYNQENNQVFMTAVRPTYPHSKCPLEPGTYGPSFLLTDAQDNLVGYFSDPIVWDAETNKDRIMVSDSAGDPSQQLRMLGQIARQYGCKGVDFFNLAYQSTLARCIRRGRYEVTIEKARNGRGNPMRIINLESTLSKMAGELSQRLQAHGHGNWSGKLRFAVDDQTALLTAKQGVFSVASDGKTSHVVEGGQEIVRLLIGTDGADEVVAEGGIQLEGDAEWLVRVLFPPQHPVLPNEYL